MTQQHPQQHPQPASGADTGDDRVAAALAVVEAAIGWELDEEGRDAVRERVAGHLKLGDALRAFPLENADEPDFVFSAYRAEG
jgi:hypothetical protein